MDKELLVEQRDDGRKVLEQLARDGFPVRVAFWARTGEDAPWLLYVASPLEGGSTRDAYRKLYAAVDRVASPWVTLSDVKLMDAKAPAAEAAVEVRDRSPAPPDVNYGGRKLGDMTIRGSFIYTTVAAPRLLFTVDYVREGDSDVWRPFVRPGQLHRGMRARGAVSYSSGLWEGETEADRRHAGIGVLVEIDPRYDHPEYLNDPAFLGLLADEALGMADRRFKEHHPDAKIRREESERLGPVGATPAPG